MPKKIFIIEDETALLYALQAQLKVEGFEVDSAMDGEQALKKLKTSKPDLIVLDILLPKVDGWAVLHRLRADVRLVNVPVIIVSNLIDKHSRAKGLELGAREFITKADCDLAEIIGKIKAALKD